MQSLIYLTLVFFLLREVEETTAIDECTGFDAPARALARSDYDFLIRNSTFEEPSNRRVVLVVLDPTIESEELISNLCTQREFTARVIGRLNELQVSVIALDKVYGSKRCPDDDLGTKNLQEAIKRSRATITRGIDTQIVTELASTGTMSTAAKFIKSLSNEKHLCLALRSDSNLRLNVEDGRSGLLRLDPNTKLAPIQWPVRVINEIDGIDRVEDRKTLSFVTARAAEPQAVESHLIKLALSKHQQPYSTRVAIPPPYSAAQVLCGHKYTKTTDWRSCKSEEPLSELKDAVVVFGDHIGDADRHPDVHNPTGIYGVDLQANYVAAILDKRCYMPLLSTPANLAFIGGTLLLLNLCFHFFKPLWVTLLVSVVAWVGIAGLSFLIVSYTGYLFTLWTQGITLTSIFVTALHHWTPTED